MNKELKIGNKIYVPSSYYVYRGEDDFEGGLAEISKIEYSKHLPEEHINSIMIGIKERPSCMYNYKILLSEQQALKKEYGIKKAHPEPDYREEFNCSPNADWR